MLENYAFLKSEEERVAMFQHDGVPPHYGNIIREALNEKFAGHLIGQGSLIPWPLRSPDLTPLNFFL
jgi:hypothetical protein